MGLGKQSMLLSRHYSFLTMKNILLLVSFKYRNRLSEGVKTSCYIISVLHHTGAR